MATTTTRPAASCARRHFSNISSFSTISNRIAPVAAVASFASPAAAPSSSSPPSSTNAAPAAAAAANTPSALPWLTRYLNLWDQQSGTREILQLKHNVNQSSAEFDAKQHAVSKARTSVDLALRAFEQSQLQHMRLLQSRDKWTSIEALEFARVLEDEVRVRSELEIAKKDLSKLENEQLEVMHRYMSDLRRRYHEEQLWQDKWRVYSTFGTWGLIVLNTAVFMISQYMARLRETQRMREIQDSIRQSLLTNEGTLRIQGQHDGEEIEERKTINNERHAMTLKPDQEIAKDARGSNEASEAGAAVENVDCSHTNIAPSDQTERESSLLSPFRYWSTLRQFATNASSRVIFAERITTVDLPSAVLGASIMGLAWAVASSRK
jgi:hypothetical protein